MEKLCRICGKIKSIDNFWKHDKMADGYRNECKECSNKMVNKERRRELNLEKEIRIDGTKICRICNIEKDIKDFHIKKGTPDGHRHECKECVKDIQKKYKEADGFKDKQKEYDKKRYDELREKVLERKKEYHIKNKETILRKKKEYRKTEDYKILNKQWRTDNKELLAEHQAKYREKYPHIVAWRSVLYSTLDRLGTPKEGHTIDMLGYSALELKEHIEKQFLEGMTWDNHGEWHIDHIKPVVSFLPTADVKEVCALSNLQPLWEFDNLSKNCY